MSSRLDWYPGLMARTKRFLDRYAKRLDCFLEVTDARAPDAARWSGFGSILGDNVRLLLLNKADLADPQITAAWLAHYRMSGEYAGVLALDAAVTGGDARRHATELLQAIRSAVGLGSADRRPVKVGVVGIPNVGKSTVLNLLAGRKRAPAGARPGLTRGHHWVVVSQTLWLLDLPGVLPPVVRSQSDVHRLALIGSAPDGAYDSTEAAIALLHWLLDLVGPTELANRLQLRSAPTPDAGNQPAAADADALQGYADDTRNYGVDNAESGDSEALLTGLRWLAAYATRRGLLLSGGRPDIPRASAVLISEFRRGILGRITLELPPDPLPENDETAEVTADDQADEVSPESQSDPLG